MGRMDWVKDFIRSSWQMKVRKKHMSGDKFDTLREHYYECCYGKPLTDAAVVNRELLDRLKSGEPFAVTRNGMWEVGILVKLQRDRLWGTDSAAGMDDMFDSREERQRYYDLTAELMPYADYVVNWFNINMESHYNKQFLRQYKGMRFCHDDGVSNFLLKDPDSWIYGLEGKKVLVVSPFVEYMSEQYKKRDLLWTGIRIPEFELHTVKSVFWYDGFKDPRFESWFEALEYLYGECCKEDFDVALLGCSTFSTPLALRFRRDGKQAVHVGGPLQLMFGIKGKRWDQYFVDTYNEHWISLPEETKVGNVDALDMTGGSYW
jgi:hypothetical protein